MSQASATQAILQNDTQGPQEYAVALDFTLYDHKYHAHRLYQYIGRQGLLLGFPGNVYELGSIRRLLWLQRQARKLALAGINAIFVVPNEATDLHAYHLSTPDPVPFLLLADPKREVYEQYRADHPTMLLLDHEHCIRRQWLLKDATLPHTGEIVRSAG
jgi:peroxiredoxin